MQTGELGGSGKGLEGPKEGWGGEADDVFDAALDFGKEVAIVLLGGVAAGFVEGVDSGEVDGDFVCGERMETDVRGFDPGLGKVAG